MVEQIAVGAVDTPIGVLWMACSAQGVCKLVFPCEGAKTTLHRWLVTHIPDHQYTATSPVLEQTTAELSEYFDGRRQDFAVPLDLHGSHFQKSVWQALTSIPFGHVLSYGSLARHLGAPKAARAVGVACGANPVPILAP